MFREKIKRAPLRLFQRGGKVTPKEQNNCILPFEDTDVKARHRRIKSALALRGIKFIDIARKLNVSTGQITNVSVGRKFNETVAKALARDAGIPFEELWPEHKSGTKAA